MIFAALVVAAATLARLWVAAVVPLAPDEAYYWIWSRALAASFYDHPPMVALWIRASTDLLGMTPLGVRLLGPLSAAVASLLLADAGRCLFPGTRAGAIAVLMLNATLLLGGGSIIMTPDSPLLAFWTATLWALARLTASGRGGWWLVAGVFAGLAGASKYTAFVLWAGIGLWTVLTPAGRVWLRRWQPWAALVVCLLLFTPVLAWNAAHGWVGFMKQGGRFGAWRLEHAAGFLTELVGGQIGLATPWVFALCMVGMVVAVRRAWRDPRWALLAALSVPAVLVFVQHALGERVEGNWPAVIYPALGLAAAGWVEARRRRDWIGAAALGYGLTVLVYVQVLFGVMPLPPRLDPVALRLGGWDVVAHDVEAARVGAGATFVAADGYDVASELAWLLPAGARVVGVDARWALFTLPRASIGGTVGLLLRDARWQGPPKSSFWTEAVPLGVVTRPGSSTGFAVYRVVAVDHPPVAALLPNRR